MNAAELRKSLDNGLRADSSGKTTPMQRLTPFLYDLVKYLEEKEAASTFIEGATVVGHLDERGAFVMDQVISSDAATQAAPALPTSENGSASKVTA